MSIKGFILFATAGFSVVALPSFVETHNAFHALIYGVGASVCLGFIGYFVGHIFAHPKGSNHSVIRVFIRDLFTLRPLPREENEQGNG